MLCSCAVSSGFLFTMLFDGLTLYLEADPTLTVLYPPAVLATYAFGSLVVSFSSQVDAYILPSERGKSRLGEFGLVGVY